MLFLKQAILCKQILLLKVLVNLISTNPIWWGKRVLAPVPPRCWKPDLFPEPAPSRWALIPLGCLASGWAQRSGGQGPAATWQPPSPLPPGESSAASPSLPHHPSFPSLLCLSQRAVTAALDYKVVSGVLPAQHCQGHIQHISSWPNILQTCCMGSSSEQNSAQGFLFFNFFYFLV